MRENMLPKKKELRLNWTVILISLKVLIYNILIFLIQLITQELFILNEFL